LVHPPKGYLPVFTVNGDKTLHQILDDGFQQTQKAGADELILSSYIHPGNESPAAPVKMPAKK